MDNAAAQYRRALEKKLRCGRDVISRLLGSFDSTLTAYLEEHPDPAMDDLSAAFGPPEEMAEILMAEVTPQEIVQHRRNSLLRRILAGILIVVLLLSTVYIWFYKNNGLTIINNSSIIDRTTEPISSIEQGDNVP